MDRRSHRRVIELSGSDPAERATSRQKLGVVIAFLLFAGVVASALYMRGDPIGEATPHATALALGRSTVPPTAMPIVLPSARVVAESAAWDQIAIAAPEGFAVVYPTVLPPSIDRRSVRVTYARSGSDFKYRVEYDGLTGTSALLFGAGDPPSIAAQVRQAGIGIVRNRGGELFAGAAGAGPRRLDWDESQGSRWIYSEVLSGNEIVAIAWHLASLTPPPRLSFIYQRATRGQCAAPGLSPQQLATRMVEFIGAGQRDALYDCVATEAIPTTFWRFDALAAADRVADSTATVLPAPFGDRVLVRLDLQFARPQPGLFTGDTSVQLVIGTEDGMLRIFGLRGGSDPPLP